jgi:hypothetical protein
VNNLKKNNNNNSSNSSSRYGLQENVHFQSQTSIHIDGGLTFGGGIVISLI